MRLFENVGKTVCLYKNVSTKIISLIVCLVMSIEILVDTFIVCLFLVCQ